MTYDVMLADLVAKRDALNAAIAAMAQVRGLWPAAQSELVPVKAEKRVAAKGAKRAKSGDDAYLAAIRKSRVGLRLSEVCKALDVTYGSAHYVLGRLVRDGLLERDGNVYKAGAPAKEAV